MALRQHPANALLEDAKDDAVTTDSLFEVISMGSQCCQRYVDAADLRLWYARDSPFELVAYTNSDYASATQDRKSTTGGCQFLGSRLISWQCKKQTIVATSTTEVEYVAAANLLTKGFDARSTARSAQATTKAGGVVMITATIDGQVKTITEASLRRHLILEDHDDKLTFQKGTFSPQWRFLIHTVLHCLSLKKTSWEQFSSNIAIAIIYLATNKKYNFSKLIFKHMVTNISSPYKYLMYPRFIQICLDMQKKYLKPHTRTYLVPSLNAKVFNNMKRTTKGYPRVEIDLFPTILHVPTPDSSHTSSPSRITSSPSLLTEHSSEPSHEPSTTALTTSEPQPDIKAHVPTPHDSPLHTVHSHESREGSMQQSELTVLVTKLYDRIKVLVQDLLKTKKTYSIALTKLVLKVKKLHKLVKTDKSRRRAQVVLSEEEDVLDDSSKQGRKILDIDEYLDTYLVQDNRFDWIQEDTDIQKVHHKKSDDNEVIMQDHTPTEVIQDQGSAERGQHEVSTAGIQVNNAGVTTSTVDEPTNTASVIPIVSTASTVRREIRSTAGRVVYSRRSVEKKDKGKAIMTEPEPNKKSKKEIEQERLSLAKAIRLQEQINEEQKAQIVRDDEIAKQWEEQERLRSKSEAKASKEIDWSDPSVQRYWALRNKPQTDAQARQNMITYLNNQSNYKARDFKAEKPEEVQEEKDEGGDKPEQIENEVSTKPRGKRWKLLTRKRSKDTHNQDSLKRQKIDKEDTTDYEKEKEELRMWLSVVPNEEAVVNPEILHTRYPIVDWESQSLGDIHVYKIIRADGNASYHKTFESMDWDQQAWHETLANYLLSNRFHRGKIDLTLFIKRQKGDILLIQVYVDDIIFGSTKKEMCDDFEKLIKDKFQMSSMGELTFILGLQVKQKKDGIFISQDKYIAEILRKFNYIDVKSTSTTIDLEKPFTKDEDAEDVDVHLYRSMIGSLMYLTASRPDIMFAVRVYARFQVTPKTSHLTAVKRIFRYLKGKPTLGLWYARDSPFELAAYTDSDYVGATQDRKSTTGGCQFLGSRLISWQCKKQNIVATSTIEAEYVAAASYYLLTKGFDAGSTARHNMVEFLEKSTGSAGFHPAIDFLSRSHISYALTRKPEVYISFIKQFWRTAEATTDDDGEIKITATIDGQSKTITEASLRRHLKLEDHDGVEVIPNTEIFEQLALMGYNTYSNRVNKLETRVKTGRARRRARLVLSEEEHDSLDDSSKQGRKILDIDEDPDTYLAQDDGVEWIQEDTDMQEAQHKQSDDTEVIMQDQTPTEVIQDQGSTERGQPDIRTAGIPVSTARVTTGTAKETPTLSTAHINISTASTIRREIRSNAGRVVYSRRSIEKKDKGKAIMTEPKPVKKSKKLLEQERLGYETAVRLLRAESEAKESKEIDWSDPLVQRYWALKNKPKTEVQARQNMITYLKNQSNYKSDSFKGTSYDEIRLIFERVWKFNQDFLAKKPEEDQEQEEKGEEKPAQIEKEETSKRQKLDKEETTDYEKEKEELRMWLLVVPDEEVVVDLKTLFDPDEEDEVWRNQHEWRLLKWKLHEFSEIHTLSLWGLEAEEESTIALELIKSQIEE
ncbi:putative ribonuclease H-like domain-containing protein [Tanacetum coccineum]|uniref:Ribonuclease H-like domain-containing protein n=1 Tax=Tanacetum coccineum TaxID=301880 RepID=A0ABQ5F7L3_9ASTR